MFNSSTKPVGIFYGAPGDIAYGSAVTQFQNTPDDIPTIFANWAGNGAEVSGPATLMSTSLIARSSRSTGLT